MELLTQLGIDLQFVLIAFVGFVILVWVLSKYAFGPIANTLQARQDKIQSDLDEAEARRAEMVALQRDYETRLAAIEDEARDKIQAAVREAQAARDEIIRRAQDDAQAIVRRGEEEVASERAKSLVEARNQIVDLATMMARQSAGQNLNAQGQSHLIDEAIASIGAQNGGSTRVNDGGLRIERAS